jgi:nicotinic acid phosphoribosyltransferase
MKTQTHRKEEIHEQVVFEEVGCRGSHSSFDPGVYIGSQEVCDALKALCSHGPVRTIQY